MFGLGIKRSSRRDWVARPITVGKGQVCACWLKVSKLSKLSSRRAQDGRSKSETETVDPTRGI